MMRLVTRRDSAEQLEFVGAEWLDEEAPSGAFLERWYVEQVRGDGESRRFEKSYLHRDRKRFCADRM